MQKKNKNRIYGIIIGNADCRRSIETLLLIELIYAALSLCMPILFRNVIDTVSLPEKTSFYSSLSAYIGLIFAVILLLAGARHFDELSRINIESIIKANTVTAVLKKQIGDISQYSTGSLASRIVSDSETIASCLITILKTSVSGFIRAFGAIMLLAYYEPSFIWLLLVLLFASLLTGFLLQSKTRRCHNDAQEADSLFRSFLQELLVNLLPIRTFAVEKRIHDHVTTLLTEYQEKRMQRNEIMNVYQTAVTLFAQAGRITGILWCSAMVYRQESSIGTMLAVLQLINMFQQSVSVISGCVSQYHMLTASEDRITQIVHLQEEIKLMKEPDEAFSFQRIRGKNLSFSYPQSQKQVLIDFNFSVEKGQFVALTGSSGAGKSTILKMMLALYAPDSGSLVIETENGIVQPLSVEHRRLFAYVPQRNLFLSGKVIDAITMQNEDQIDYSRLEGACRNACLDFLDDIHTAKLGEAGSGFSEGQLQRIAIARALYSDAEVLLLDEATSALDEETERRVLQNLSELSEKTVIAVSHRLLILEYCDLEINMERPRLS